MAKILQRLSDPVRKELYPWTKWFDGIPRLIEAGSDYTVDSTAFRSSAYQAAKRHGVMVTVRMAQDGVEIQARKREDSSL